MSRRTAVRELPGVGEPPGKLRRCRHGFRTHQSHPPVDADDRAPEAYPRRSHFPGCKAGAPAAGGTRRLRDATRILGRRHRDGLDPAIRSARTTIVSASASGKVGSGPSPPCALGRFQCFGHTDLTERDATRRAAPHHAGGRDGVPAPSARPVAAAGADDRRARLPGRGAGGGPRDRSAAAQAAAVRGVGVPGGVGRGAGVRCAEPATEPAVAADHPAAGGWGVPGGGNDCLGLFPSWTASEIRRGR